MRKKFIFLSLVSLLLTGCTNTPMHTVVFNSNGGSEVLPQKIEHGSKANQPNNPTKLGYDFINWTYKGEEWSFVGFSVTEDMTLDANWSIITYTITYNLNGGTNDLYNPSKYTVESPTIALADPSKTGYTFTGWTSNGSPITSIQKGSFGDLKLTANWSVNKYSAFLNANGGECSIPSINITYGSSYSLPIPTRIGYTFTGWYNDATRVSNNGIWNYTSNLSLIAHWDVIDYTITYNLNGGINNSSNPSIYTIESSFTLLAPTKTGYTFTGWFDDKGNQITQISSGRTGALTLIARWDSNQNILTVTSEDATKGTVSITAGNGYTDELITVVATPDENCIFKGWYHNDSKVSNDVTYTFTMPANDYSLVAHFFTRAEEETWNRAHGVTPTLSDDGKTITYGLYPQKNVNDPSLVSLLDSLPVPESNGWYLYNDEYYAKTYAHPYSGYSFDNGVKIKTGAAYWFECKPITWNVLSENNGEYYVLSSVLLDAHLYDTAYVNRTIDGKTIYPNNYEHSKIREWLNNEFYNSAFALGNSNIQTTTVNNSSNTTDSTSTPYSFSYTHDKVFLPSWKDYNNSDYGFSSEYTRYCLTTDWARARGASAYVSGPIAGCYMNGTYWTRSPSSEYPRYVWIVSSEGGLHVSYAHNDVYNNNFSVRSAITLKIA